MKASKTTTANDTLLCIDFGETNIGVAFGKGGFVAPVKIISGKNTDEAIKELSRLTIENKVSKIIIGLPLSGDGKETKESLIVRRFAKILKIYTKKPLEFENENGTSIEAMDEAWDLGVAQKRRRKIDHYSAAIILKHYYDRIL